MHPPDYLPQDPENEMWDAVVIGTGMGGSTTGYVLAAKGRKVLFLEKGRFLFGDVDRGNGQLPLDPDESPESRLDRGWWPHPLQGRTSFGEAQFFAPLGCGSGGTTGLYAAQLERLAPSDFRPRANFPDITDSALPESWPISYAELLPHYRRAEALYRVCGTADPLDGEQSCSLREPPALSERDREMEASFKGLGLHPYRAHVGYDFIEGCDECGGVLCPRGCKSDAGRICLVPALRDFGAKILANCEVLALEADAAAVRRVRCRYEGRELSISARLVVLAAGAFMTPVLLLNSKSEHWPGGLANTSGQVGRNLMMHASDFIAISSTSKRSTAGPRKALALNDFYLHGDKKLGTFQSVGTTVDLGTVMYYLRSRLGRAPQWLRKLASPFLRVIAYVGAYLFRNAAVFATIIEDLPYDDNRVIADPKAKNGMRFEYRYAEELRIRTRILRERLSQVLKPRHRLMVLNNDNNLNFGHPCGTCRFGDDPATSVLDQNNRAHDVANLYVVDASFFPSSGGTNPSLTIAANALRVAEAIDEHLERLGGGRPNRRP
jgi:choline dehydrogenase-like flavoprotein